MKRIGFIVLTGWLIATSGSAQITITNEDMPAPGDTLRISMTNQVPGDYTQTAFDTTWDFSMLEPVTQRVENFVGLASVPPEFWFVFIPSIVSNLASPGNINLPVPGFPITDSHTFYNNTSNGFSDVGNAMKVSGLPLSLKYDVPDLWYPFPLSPGDDWNTSSFAGISIPGFAYFSNSRSRTSTVDGWGTLITPYGTFNTLRVKSTLVQADSISVDSMGIHLPFTRNITQYKWLAKGEGIPVLQVNEELGMVSASYRDLYRTGAGTMRVDIGPDTSVLHGQPITLTASLTNAVPPYRYVWSTFDTTSSVTLIIDSTVQIGVAVFDALNNIAIDMATISVKFPPAIEENKTIGLQISPNPAAGGSFVVTLPGPVADGLLRVADPGGRMVLTKPITGASGKMVVEIPGMQPGSYIVTVETAGKRYAGKVIIP